MKKFNEFGKLLCKMQTSVAGIELRMANSVDDKPLYRLIEYPRDKNATWETEIIYFIYSKNANAEFIKRCEYWII